MKAACKEVQIGSIIVVIWFREDGRVSIDNGATWTETFGAALTIAMGRNTNNVCMAIGDQFDEIDWEADFPNLTFEPQTTDVEVSGQEPPLPEILRLMYPPLE